jgi:hypothetical protein
MGGSETIIVGSQNPHIVQQRVFELVEEANGLHLVKLRAPVTYLKTSNMRSLGPREETDLVEFHAVGPFHVYFRPCKIEYISLYIVLS